MKKTKLATVCVSGVIVSVILFLLTIRLHIKDGYARDAGIYVSKLISIASWVLLGFCIIAFILFFVLSKLSDKKWTLHTPAFFLTILIIFGLSVNIGWKVSFDRAKNADIQHENLNPITLEELKTTIHGKEFQVVYIGRDSCPLCEYIMPDFLEYLESTNLDVLYYNTKNDRETRAEEMREVLDSIPVHGVPFIMVVDNQEIVATFEGEHVVNELKAYIENSIGT